MRACLCAVAAALAISCALAATGVAPPAGTDCRVARILDISPGEAGNGFGGAELESVEVTIAKEPDAATCSWYMLYFVESWELEGALPLRARCVALADQCRACRVQASCVLLRLL